MLARNDGIGTETIRVVIDEVVDVEYEFFPCEASHVDFLRVHADGIHLAGFHAEAAEHAAQEIGVINFSLLFDMGVWIFLGDNFNALSRTRGRAEHTGGATNRTILLFHQTMLAAIAVRNGFCLFGIFVDGQLAQTHHVFQQVTQGNHETFKCRKNINAFQHRHGTAIQDFNFDFTFNFHFRMTGGGCVHKCSAKVSRDSKPVNGPCTY